MGLAHISGTTQIPFTAQTLLAFLLLSRSFPKKDVHHLYVLRSSYHGFLAPLSAIHARPDS